MKKYFVYELKKNVLPLIMLTVVALSVYMVVLGVNAKNFVRVYENGTKGAGDPYLSIIFTILGTYCFIVPMCMCAFKMKKRGVDAFYSLPIKKEKLYFVKTLVGLLLVFIPYTIAYWAGFAAVACSKNIFSLGWYVPAYFGSVLFGICIYGITAFAFTRANNVCDGVIFALMYTFAGFFLTVNLPRVSLSQSELFISFGSLDLFGSWMSDLIAGNKTFLYVVEGDYVRAKSMDALYKVFIFLIPVLIATLAYFFFFRLLRREKAENSEQLSESILGYKIMLPLYTVCLMWLAGKEVMLGCVFMVFQIALTCIYRRKVLFNWKYWLMLCASGLIGILLGVAM